MNDTPHERQKKIPAKTYSSNPPGWLITSLLRRLDEEQKEHLQRR